MAEPIDAFIFISNIHLNIFSAQKDLWKREIITPILKVEYVLKV